jgi:hypothetical protein
MLNQETRPDLLVLAGNHLLVYNCHNLVITVYTTGAKWFIRHLVNAISKGTHCARSSTERLLAT